MTAVPDMPDMGERETAPVTFTAVTPSGSATTALVALRALRRAPALNEPPTFVQTGGPDSTTVVATDPSAHSAHNVFAALVRDVTSSPSQAAVLLQSP